MKPHFIASLAPGRPDRPAQAAERAGGIPDKVYDGRSGRLVLPGNPVALRAGLLELLERRQGWPAMGQEGARIVRQRFDWPVVARATLAVYEEMPAQSRG